MEGMFFSFIYCKKYIFDLIIEAAASRYSCTALIVDRSH